MLIRYSSHRKRIQRLIETRRLSNSEKPETTVSFALGDWHRRWCPSPRLETEEQVFRKMVSSVLVIQTTGTIFHGVLPTPTHFAKYAKNARP